MQINDIFHNCPEQQEQQEQQQQSDPKDLGSKFPRSKNLVKWRHNPQKKLFMLIFINVEQLKNLLALTIHLPVQ